MLKKFSDFRKFLKISESGLSTAYKMALMRSFHRFGIPEAFYHVAVKLLRANSEHMVSVEI